MFRKVFLLSASFLITAPQVFPQKKTVDSLWKAYEKNRQDTTRVAWLLTRAFTGYRTTNLDSGIILCRQALALSRKTGFKKGEVRALSVMSGLLQFRGDLAGALQLTFEVLPQAEHLHEIRAIASCYNTRGLVYSALNQHQKALDNYYAFDHILEKYRLKSLEVTALNNLARLYLEINRVDSAAYFNEKAYQIWRKEKAEFGGYLIRNFGIIRYKKKDFPGAIAWYRKSLADSGTKDNDYLKSEDYRRIAESYLQLHRTDSCIYYSGKAYQEAKLSRTPQQVQQATAILAEAYLAKGDFKQAYAYQQLTQQVKDSVFSQEKTMQVQNVVFSEEQRNRAILDAQAAYRNRLRFFVLLGILAAFALFAGIMWYANGQRKKANLRLKEQNAQIESQRKSLETTLAELKTTQAQLIQSEKMASLGELTAGIAHEIQNPLNFINNFSEVNAELIAEMMEGIGKGDLDEVRSLAEDVKQNQEKISQHGRRADFIVKGMLQHSRNSTGEKQPTQLNILCDEFFKLSFHGLRAKDKSFNAEMRANFDPALPAVRIVQQDIGRVVLNLINNAFYAVSKKAKSAGPDYKPVVELTTGHYGNYAEIRVKDNGSGIPESVREKIFQPFFTTKPTGEGTGLGLSLSYDIVVKGHGGKIAVQSSEGSGSEFVIQLPLAEKGS